jgi:hypothetical protein
VVEEARKLGIEVDDYRDLRRHDLEKLDSITRGYFGSNKVAAARVGLQGRGGLRRPKKTEGVPDPIRAWPCARGCCESMGRWVR